MCKLNLKVILFFFLSISGVSCSVYKSEGRKSFENQSPGQIRTLSLIRCTDVEDLDSVSEFQETKIYSELVWTPLGHKVHLKMKNTKIYAQVDLMYNSELKTCSYQAKDLDEWLRLKDNLYNEIDSLFTPIEQI